MERIAICLLFSCLTLQLTAQFSDDFSDGDFSVNPVWTGDSSLFEVKVGQLHLNAPALSGEAHLATSSFAGIGATWKFRVKMDFNPSASNYSRIYLMADSSDLNANLRGYFVQIGGGNDDISLYRQDGSLEILLINGKDDRLNASTIDVTIMVRRDNQFQWNLWTDTTAGSSYASEGVIYDSTYWYSLFSGISCNYTSTRSDKFYFDDFEVFGSIYHDTKPPRVLEYRMLSERKLEVLFSEQLDPASLHGAIVQCDCNAGVPQLVLTGDADLLEVTFPGVFPHGQPIEFSLRSIADTAGNQILPTALNGLYNYPDSLKYRDIIFNEIMADPSPSVGLPESEYIELYNRGKAYIDMSGWRIADARDTAVLNGILPPGSFLNLVVESDSTLWDGYTGIIFPMNLPALNNAGDKVSLINPYGKLIDAVEYTDKWYGNNKAEGGWSLELIDPDFRCSVSSNWQASTAAVGGTPDAVNSIFDSTALYEPLAITKILKVTDSLIRLELSGIVDVSDFKLAQIHFQPELPVDSFKSYAESRWDIFISNAPKTIGSYKLILSDFSDCAGNSMINMDFPFFFAEESDFNDIIINEVLFNPRTGGSDFVEIYNRSDRAVDLDGWYLANIADDSISSPKMITEEYLLLSPGDYLVLTEDVENVRLNYPQSNYQKMMTMDLPSYPDKSGNVLLLDDRNILIDRLDYNEKMHLPVLDDIEGVSLERIHAHISTNDLLNWHSAASLAGYATPGYKNSQSGELEISRLSFYTEPDIFSPDNDGFDDYVSINYKFEEAGNLGSINIYDATGKLVRELISNELLETEGTVIWDGMDQHLTKAPMGYYIVLLESFNNSGKVRKQKASVVLAHSL